MSNLLKDLQKLKPKFPEATVYVPEWDREVTLRSFSLLEGRLLRAADTEADNEQLMLRTLAHAIADGEARPLANPEGIALLDTLSARTIEDMGKVLMKLNGAGQDAEGNSAARAVADGSSSDSPSPSAVRSLN